MFTDVAAKRSAEDTKLIRGALCLVIAVMAKHDNPKSNNIRFVLESPPRPLKIQKEDNFTS